MRRRELSAFGPENLKLKDAPIPAFGDNEVLIKVNAVALNYRDQEVIAGNKGEFNWPVTLASDMSDAVVGAGRSIAQFAVGNRVISTFFPEWRDGRPIIDARYGLSNLPQALEHLNRGAFGKIVIGLSL